MVAGEGFAGELCSPSATKRSFVANPRPPGYEKVSAFPKTIETTQSYRLTEFSGCARWVSLVQSDPRVTPPFKELRSQNGLKSSDSNGLISSCSREKGATPESAPCRCRCYRSQIFPPYMRRSPKVAEVLPILYLRGLFFFLSGASEPVDS